MAKRKPKQAITTQQVDRLLSNERVLIVCEGTKTEKHYFEDLRRVYGLGRCCFSCFEFNGDLTT